jgi:glycosyltransferase involved in cell wall biosynthesis
LPANIWTILTGEYPPQPGGVSDYTHQVAEALAAAGDQVHVFAPPASPGLSSTAVRLHRLPDHFGKRGLRAIQQHLRDHPSTRLLIQYVPHAFGCHAMNVRLCRWIRTVARGGIPSDIMFHEVAYPLEPGQPLKHKLLALVNRQMARWVADTADRIFISIPRWESILKNLGVNKPIHWLPVPSNISLQTDSAAVAATRVHLGGPTIIAHFGTYGPLLVPDLTRVLAPLAQASSSRKLLLLGRGGPALAVTLQKDFPDLAGRVIAPGELDAANLAVHLAAADLLVQPHHDGISCRRSSSMAGLALGVPLVSCIGPSTESIWAQSHAVALAPAPDPAQIVTTAEAALADPATLPTLGHRGQHLYQEKFDIRFTIAALRAQSPAWKE